MTSDHPPTGADGQGRHEATQDEVMNPVGGPRQSRSRRRVQDEVAIAALGARMSHEEAAARAGMSSRTLRRRLENQDFVRRVAEARERGLQRALAELDSGLEEALVAARELVRPGNQPSVRLKAAQVLLSGSKLRELEIEHRLVEVERAVDVMRDSDPFGESPRTIGGSSDGRAK